MRAGILVLLCFLCISPELQLVQAAPVSPQTGSLPSLDLLSLAQDAIAMATHFTENNPQIVNNLAQCFQQVDSNKHAVNVTSTNLIRDVISVLKDTHIRSGPNNSTSCDMLLISSLMQYSLQVGSHLASRIQPAQAPGVPGANALTVSRLLSNSLPNVLNPIFGDDEQQQMGRSMMHGHGTHPDVIWMGMTFQNRLSVILPLVITGFFVFAMSWVVGKVRRPRPNEVPAEKLRRVFGTFEHFSLAMSKVEVTERTQWVRGLCVLANDADGALLGDIVPPWEHAEQLDSGFENIEAPTEAPLLSKRIQSAIAREDRTNELSGTSPELPKSKPQPDQEADQEQPQQVESDGIENSGKNTKTQREGNTKSVSARGKEDSGSGEARDDEVSMMQIETSDNDDTHNTKKVGKETKNGTQNDNDVDPLMIRAEQCWGSLREEVIQTRDIRSWRVMVKRSMRALSFLLAVSGTLLYFLAIMGPGTTSCDQGQLAIEGAQAIESCDTSYGFELCRCACLRAPDAAARYGYHMCFAADSVGDKQGEWIALVTCPNLPSPSPLPVAQDVLSAPDIFFG